MSSRVAGSARKSLTTSLIVLVALALAPAVAHAGLQAGAGPTFPTTVTVGDTGVMATIEMRNDNTPPNSGDPNTVCNFGDAFPCPVGDPGITFIPSCGQLGAFSVCNPAGADPGVFQLPPTATGQVGTACSGMVFNVTVADPTFGTLRFTPQGGAHVVLPGAGTICRIGFTFGVAKMPGVDQNPIQAGVQTVQIVDNTQFSGLITASARGTSSGTTVLRAPTSIVTTASPDIPVGSGTVTTTATVSGIVNPVPGATITFVLYGPDDVICTGPPVYTSGPIAYPGGPLTSPQYTPTQPGTYQWVVVYSGDANNAPSSTACSDAGGTVVVNLAQPAIVTTASQNITLGAGTLTDTATVTGRVNPVAGATITWSLYGPGDADCTGAPVFSPAPVAYPAAGGPIASPSFTPTQAGTYRWIAGYSGDASNLPVTGACNDAGETVVVSRAQPAIVTTASQNVTLGGGGTLTDTATVNGRVNPVAGATITWTLYGPGDASCTDPPVFSPTPVAYPAAGGPVTSPAFTPTQAGTYRWIAAYSGDANNRPVSGACNDAGETVVVSRAQPAIATNAPASVALGGALTDTATVTGRVNPVAGATITWRLYINDDTCSNVLLFTSAAVPYPVSGGAVTSPPFVPTEPGTYRWIATYSGDANNLPVSGACNDANETTTVTPAAPAILTTASLDVAVGSGTLTDTATVTGRANPLVGATITWRLYGPDDATCTGTPAFAPAPVPYPVSGGSIASPAFTPRLAGIYRWIAAYSGDANNLAVTGACNDPDEATTVTAAAPPPPQAPAPPPAPVPPPPPPPAATTPPPPAPPPPPSAAELAATPASTPESAAAPPGATAEPTPGTSDCTARPGPPPPGGRICNPGTATVVGRSGCQGVPFRVVVRGREIVRVIFAVDGRVRQTLSAPNRGGLYVLPVNPGVYKFGVHRVNARTYFSARSATPPRMLRVAFMRCSRRLTTSPPPTFTG